MEIIVLEFRNDVEPHTEKCTCNDKCDLCKGSGHERYENGYVNLNKTCRQCGGTGFTTGRSTEAPVIESWEPIDTAPIDVPVWVKDDEGNIAIGVAHEIIYRFSKFGDMHQVAWKVYFNTIAKPEYWLPVNWPGA